MLHGANLPSQVFAEKWQPPQVDQIPGSCDHVVELDLFHCCPLPGHQPAARDRRASLRLAASRRSAPSPCLPRARAWASRRRDQAGAAADRAVVAPAAIGTSAGTPSPAATSTPAPVPIPAGAASPTGCGPGPSACRGTSACCAARDDRHRSRPLRATTRQDRWRRRRYPPPLLSCRQTSQAVVTCDEWLSTPVVRQCSTGGTYA